MVDVLTVTGLEKRFGGIVVADNIELALAKGRVLGLIGPNGAGKTSFFNLVCGVVKPDAGSIVLGGQEINSLPIRERARMGLARTWQNLRLFQSLSVLDNLHARPARLSAPTIFSTSCCGPAMSRTPNATAATAPTPSSNARV